MQQRLGQQQIIEFLTYQTTYTWVQNDWHGWPVYEAVKLMWRFPKTKQKF